MEKYYIGSAKMSIKLQDTKMDVDGIKIGDKTYVRLSAKPKGRSILRVLKSVNSPEERIIIYK